MTERKTIYLDDALEAIRKFPNAGIYWFVSAEAVFDALQNLPSAEPEIIRCKDCKWYGRADKRRFYRGMDCLQKRIDTIIPDKDFCSRAERREE